MKYLLDTDTCVYWLRGAAGVRQQVAAITPAEVGVSVVTVAELRYGAAVSAQAASNHRAIDGLTAGFAVIGVSPAIARVFGDQKAALRSQGQLIEDFDLLIGATAIHHGLTLVTNNQTHFGRLPNLKLANWVGPA